VPICQLLAKATKHGDDGRAPELLAAVCSPPLLRALVCCAASGDDDSSKPALRVLVRVAQQGGSGSSGGGGSATAGGAAEIQRQLLAEGALAAISGVVAGQAAAGSTSPLLLRAALQLLQLLVGVPEVLQPHAPPAAVAEQLQRALLQQQQQQQPHDAEASSLPSTHSALLDRALCTVMRHLRLMLTLPGVLASTHDQLLSIVHRLTDHCQLSSSPEQPEQRERSAALAALLAELGWVRSLWRWLPDGVQLLEMLEQAQGPSSSSLSAGEQQGRPDAAASGTDAPTTNLKPRVSKQLPPAAPGSLLAGTSPVGSVADLLSTLDVSSSSPTQEQSALALSALARICAHPQGAQQLVALHRQYADADASGALQRIQDAAQAAVVAAAAAAAGTEYELRPSAAGTPHAPSLSGNRSLSAAASVPQSPLPPPHPQQPLSPFAPTSILSSSAGSSGSSTGGFLARFASAPGGGTVAGVALQSEMLRETFAWDRRAGSSVTSEGASPRAAASTQLPPTALGASPEPSRLARTFSWQRLVQGRLTHQQPPQPPQPQPQPPAVPEGPHSPVHTLTELAAEQWGAATALQLLRCLAARDASALAAAQVDGLGEILVRVLEEVQDNSNKEAEAAALAALALLEIMAGGGSGGGMGPQTKALVSGALRLLRFEAQVSVPRAALCTLRALCSARDPSVCAQCVSATPLLACWMRGGVYTQCGGGGGGGSVCKGESGVKGVAAEASEVIGCLVESGAIDATTAALFVGDASQLMACCVACLPAGAAACHAPGAATAGVAAAPDGGSPCACGNPQQQQQAALVWPPLPISSSASSSPYPSPVASPDKPNQHQQQQQQPPLRQQQERRALAALRLVRALTSAHPAFPAALIDAEGLPRLVAIAAAPPGAAPLALAAESMASLDDLCLGFREDLAQCDVVAAIVNILGLPSPAASSVAAARLHGSGGRAAEGGSGESARGPAVAPGASLVLQAKGHACNLITVLAFSADVKRALFHRHAVGPLMQLAEEVGDGTAAAAAVQAALRQMGLGYLAGSAAAVSGGGSATGSGGGAVAAAALGEEME